MDFPLNDPMDEVARHDFLIALLHPGPPAYPAVVSRGA